MFCILRHAAKCSCDQAYRAIADPYQCKTYDNFYTFVVMLKKCTSFLFMAVSYAILLGHSIVPHHHHDPEHKIIGHTQDHHHAAGKDHDGSHHHGASHQHGDNGASEGLGHLFSHFIHPSDGITSSTGQSNTFSFSKQTVTAVVLMPLDIMPDACEVPPLFDRPPAFHRILQFSFDGAFGLRAPPAFTA
jgi:hypothetical protein